MMNKSSIEKCNTKIVIGTLPSSKLATLAASHPFTQQLDVVFPSNSALEDEYTRIGSSYAKGKTTLSDIVKHARTFVSSDERDSQFLILSLRERDDDVWCIDPRGILTLSIVKETYEQLGLSGTILPFKGREERYVVHIPLQRSQQSPTNWARTKDAVEQWDRRRAARGLDPWTVIYCTKDPDARPELPVVDLKASVQEVECTKRVLQSVQVPLVTLRPRPSTQVSGDDDVDDWNGEMSALFEWVGMACLGAQRLYANDRTDPFVALYNPPEPSQVGSVTHLRWRGLLSPAFVQSIIDMTSASIKPGTRNSFAAIISHAISASPVSYIRPLTLASEGSGHGHDANSPERDPENDGEDTWSLIVGPTSTAGSFGWTLAESLGRRDTRWG